LQKVLSEEQIRETIRRETSRADRTGRQFSVVLFGVSAAATRAGRRWTVSTCRMARVLLSRVRQTDDVGWFDERHLCAVLPDTPAGGARIFATRTCDEIARKQPRPTSVVYGYPGSFPFHDDDNGDDHDRDGGGGGGNGRGLGHVIDWRGAAAGPHVTVNSNGNGHGRHNGHARASGTGHSIVDTGGALAVVDDPAEAPQGLAVAEREELVGYFLDGVSSVAKQPKTSASNVPDVALEDSFVEPMPVWKRVFDLVGASIGLVLLAPLLAVAAVGIKLTSRGPVIFKQKRTGLGGRVFTIYKFRTMCVNAERYQAELRKHNEQDGPAFKLTNDPRVTRIGKLLRKTSIDELPQLINVLKGDMSLVGPRPLPVKEQDGCVPWQRHRLNVTPGLTCIWQVDGRSEVTFDEWVRMDVKYMRRRSLWSDLSILLRTVPSVLMRKGAK
jgi:lipopolysaccharide/colanic/teichoic acid biosynthesis glycosyltransferase